jgi:NitT/TauT family transport system substrate-binding protein
VVKARWIGGAGSNLDVLFTPWTVPLVLGFFRDEGVDFEFATLAGGSSTVQALTTNNADYANLTHATLLPLMKPGTDLGIKVVYTWMRKFHAGIAVLPDSPIKEIKELDGKKIGVVGMGDTGVFAGQAMMREVGLDPQKAELVVVNYGASAWKGLESKQVDALSIWDIEFARQENIGAKYRYLTVPPRIAALPGSTAGVPSKYLAENRGAVVGAMRAFSRGLAFVIANPEAAVRIHWGAYPESKPKGIEEPDALRDAIHLLQARIDKLRVDDQPDKRWGYTDPAQVETWVDVLGLKGQVSDTGKVFTNELIDDINRNLDIEKVQQMAKSYKV